MGTKRTWALASVAFLLLAAVTTVWLWASVWSYPARDSATVSWSEGGKAGEFTFKITDAGGRPLPGVDVCMVDFSGGDSGVTDADGLWTCRPDRELLVLEVNKVVVFQRDGYLSSLFAPSPGPGGTTVHVAITRPVTFRIGSAP